MRGDSLPREASRLPTCHGTARLSGGCDVHARGSDPVPGVRLREVQQSYNLYKLSRISKTSYRQYGQALVSRFAPYLVSLLGLDLHL